MNKNTLKSVIFLLLLTVSGSLLGAESSAQAQGLSNNSGSGSQLFCTRDFGNFLANGIDLDGEGFIDYWLDILDIPGYGWSRYSNNYCRFMDIDSLLNRIDKSRKQLRQAFYVCDNVSAQRIAGEYYQMSAELYYLRHFVDTDNPPNPKASDQEKAQFVTPRNTDQLWTEFKTRFVDKAKYFDQQTAKALFDKLTEKYQTKIAEYQNCTDPNLGNLKQKIKELAGTLDTIAQMGKKFAERTQAVYNKTKDRIVKEGGLIGGAFSANNFGDYMKNLVNFRVNGEQGFTKTPWEQIAGGFMQNAPTELAGEAAQSAQNTYNTYGNHPDQNNAVNKPGSAVPPNVTFDSVYGDLQTIQKRQEATDLDLQYLAELELKYRQTSGMGLDMVTVRLDDLIQIVKDTYSPMDNIKVCAANILGKQCGG